MSDITDKLKEKAKEAKDKVSGAEESAKDTVAGYDQDRVTTEAEQKEDPLTSYRDKEPMTPAKIKENESTTVKREMTERIAESGQTGTNPQEAAEIARKKVWLRDLLVYPKLVTNKNKEPMQQEL